MAPSIRSAGARTRKAQPTLLGYTKVSKPATITRGRKDVKVTIEGVEYVSKSVNQDNPQPTLATKRKRIDPVSEAKESDTEEVPAGKKVKIFLPSPPSSDRSSSADSEVSAAPCVCLGRFDRCPSPPPMPQGLQDLRDMHKAFLKAFTFHRAHNGRSSPAELNELIISMTRLYKKRSVGKEDVQRMLAIYEVEEKTEIPAKAFLVCSKAPFKLTTSGVGSNRRSFVEYISTEVESITSLQTWDEKWLHTQYKGFLDVAFLYGRRNNLSFINGPVSDYPLMAFAVGAQTAARQHKASELRKHVLGRNSRRDTSPELSSLTISDPNSPPKAGNAVKARTLSLFERIKAKQAINDAKPAPTSESVLRRHAIGRMDEVVEVLKMKQNGRLNFMLDTSEYTSPETPLRRISFTLTELVKMVKGSLTTAMADEEIKTCIDILARELPGFWLRYLNMDAMLCVVIQGRGPVGEEVKKTLKAMECRKLDNQLCDYEETE